MTREPLKFVVLFCTAAMFCSCSRQTEAPAPKSSEGADDSRNSEQGKVGFQFAIANKCADDARGSTYFLLGRTVVAIPTVKTVNYGYVGVALAAGQDDSGNAARRGCEDRPIRASRINISGDVPVLFPDFGRKYPDSIEYRSINYVGMPNIWMKSALLDEQFKQFDRMGKCRMTPENIWTCDRGGRRSDFQVI